ncbi:unnamed protein product [Penicillium roqueforti FM164]|uniref:Uncharacterized protein n=1 Tax=Penicillium roqueforti (strain FM164) TaxID=1365484 RepID=W6QQM5_PENRF|nr:unnamed protein product [Penicillium roqueforti FM164]
MEPVTVQVIEYVSVLLQEGKELEYEALVERIGIRDGVDCRGDGRSRRLATGDSGTASRVIC